eukprot:TRINITY_DN7330_c0_g1_i3.p1 TRINITY_DN7330_c0_g1~~TRINITY_DN7330_c0_g1_i3.p1  ORF type:complete len:548 (+),score=91.35 TRINITY_DN7330_c0_g1_i3:61-1704(+)
MIEGLRRLEVCASKYEARMDAIEEMSNGVLESLQLLFNPSLALIQEIEDILIEQLRACIRRRSKPLSMEESRIIIHKQSVGRHLQLLAKQKTNPSTNPSTKPSTNPSTNQIHTWGIHRALTLHRALFPESSSLQQMTPFLAHLRYRLPDRIDRQLHSSLRTGPWITSGFPTGMRDLASYTTPRGILTRETLQRGVTLDGDRQLDLDRDRDLDGSVGQKETERETEIKMQDGQDGQDGIDGQDGQDGQVPFDFYDMACHPERGDLYLTVSSRNAVVVLSSRGRFVRMHRADKFEAGALQDPRGIDVSLRGTVAVVSNGDSCVKLFTTDMQYLKALGRDGPGGRSSMYYPQGVAFDTRGNLFVSDGANRQMQQFTEDGLFVRIFAARDSPSPCGWAWGIAVDALDRLVITAEDERHMHIHTNPNAPQTRPNKKSSNKDSNKPSNSDSDSDSDSESNSESNSESTPTTKSHSVGAVIKVNVDRITGGEFVARGPQGTFVLTNRPKSKLQFYSHTGDIVHEIPMEGVNGLTLGVDGTLYVISNTESKVLMF